MMRFHGVLLGLLLVLSTPVFPADEPPKMPVEVYLSLEQALEVALPKAGRVEYSDIALTDEEVQRVQQRMGRKLFERRFRVYRSVGDGRVTGYAVVTEEIGKYQPITFIVGTMAKGTPASHRISNIAVMVYRESHGADVKRRRFLAQFTGKGLKNPLKVNRGIINVAGATLSVRAITRGVRKVLAVLEECVTRDGTSESFQWTSFQSRPAPAPTKSAGVHKQTRYLMGTVLELACHADERTARRAMTAAFAEVARLESLLSTYRPESEISRVNREAAKRPIAVSKETIECVAAALAMARQTGGAFDPTLKRDGHEHVVIDRERSTIRFTKGGLSLDLGGIGKGFALDRAAKALEAHGASQALLNFGGQMLALDPPPGADGWIAAVRDPRNPTELIGGYSLARASVSTTATYERGDHIIDPRTGAAANGALAATMCAPSATEADALSTALDVLGGDAAAELVGAGPGRAALVFATATAQPVAHRGRHAPLFVLAEEPIPAAQ